MCQRAARTTFSPHWVGVTFTFERCAGEMLRAASALTGSSDLNDYLIQPEWPLRFLP
jgi:hypothetical protein